MPQMTTRKSSPSSTSSYGTPPQETAERSAPSRSPDVVQDFFASTLEGQSRFRPAHGRPISWMCGVVRAMARKARGDRLREWGMDEPLVHPIDSLPLFKNRHRAFIFFAQSSSLDPVNPMRTTRRQAGCPAPWLSRPRNEMENDHVNRQPQSRSKHSPKDGDRS